jgi:nitroimidazol reductase NimA-like FMN-containing flavoprotein (pyridoxamine 5'-phosphate oxidase superfamily)
MRKKEREVSEIVEIESIISRCDVCRIAFADNNTPYIVTMNFGYTCGMSPKFYFHCASEGRKLEMIARNNYVCFELDTDHMITKGKESCDFSMRFSSVVGYGSITIVNDAEEKLTGLNTIMSHYTRGTTFTYRPDSFKKTTILRLDISEMTAKKR